MFNFFPGSPYVHRSTRMGRLLTPHLNLGQHTAIACGSSSGGRGGGHHHVCIHRTASIGGMQTLASFQDASSLASSAALAIAAAEAVSAGAVSGQVHRRDALKATPAFTEFGKAYLFGHFPAFGDLSAISGTLFFPPVTPLPRLQTRRVHALALLAVEEAGPVPPTPTTQEVILLSPKTARVQASQHRTTPK